MMALAAFDTFGLSQHAVFCPQPLFIQKKARRAAFRKRILRKSTHHQHNDQYVCGPLDDIIDEIKSDIWESPHNCTTEEFLFGWADPLEVPSTWTATPLPISRLPSNQPLTIRKNRESRSSTSASDMGDRRYFSRYSSQDDALDGGPVGAPALTETAPWPLFDAPTSYESAHVPSATDVVDGLVKTAAQDAIENASQRRSLPTERRPSRLRLFTGLSRLRRTDTGESSGDSGNASDLASPTSPEASKHDDLRVKLQQEPSDDAVETYVRKNARNGARLGSIIGRIARRLPSPAEYRHDDLETVNLAECRSAPTTLRAAARIYSEVTQLSREEQQDFWISVEIEGTLHNRALLPDSTIDVIFVVDNAYYVSRECLSRALDAVNGALYHLDRGDRVALYTTHCTHQSVTGNRPDLLFPIRPFGADTEEIFHAITATIAKCGTQSWKPPRPNPSMAEVILGVTKSLANENLKNRRTHVVLLSPAAHVLHDVSRSCQDVYIHQINPAAVPYRPLLNIVDTGCNDECCENVLISNWNHFQSLPGRIKCILKYARSARPVGEITKVCIDVRAKDGCEVMECLGAKDIASLRLGQVHTIFARLRITRSATKEIDLRSSNPVFNSSLDVKDLRLQLQNAVAVGAVKAHLLDVQVYYQNTLHEKDCWNYSETPFLVVRDLGGLAPPINTAVEVHRRQLFQNFVRLDADTAKTEAQALLSTFTEDQDPSRKLVQRIAKEIDRHQRVLDYEREHRQKLPLCPGPITVDASPHEWLVGAWNRKKSKHQGVAVVKEENEQEISGLIDGLYGLERLG